MVGDPLELAGDKQCAGQTTEIDSDGLLRGDDRDAPFLDRQPLLVDPLVFGVDTVRPLCITRAQGQDAPLDGPPSAGSEGDHPLLQGRQVAVIGLAWHGVSAAR